MVFLAHGSEKGLSVLWVSVVYFDWLKVDVIQNLKTRLFSINHHLLKLILLSDLSSFGNAPPLYTSD